MISKKYCVWNNMANRPCGVDVKFGSWLWCEKHQDMSDNMWRELAAKHASQDSRKKVSVETVKVEESYL